MAFTLPAGMTITWLGHSCFRVTLPNGKILLLDPFLTENPATPADCKQVDSIDLMLISHGHLDHTADAVELAKQTKCRVAGMVELIGWLGSRGVDGSQLHEMNKGGSLRFPDLGVTVTVTHAFHSSTAEDGPVPVYTGEPTGFVVTLDSGFAFYFAGDTDVFGDMALISELWNPKLALLPIGDRFTMNPRTAAKAVTLMPSLEAVIPMHYGTFPLLTGTAPEFEQQVASTGSDVAVIVLTPGETLR
jgi:L-ascorbate metabolism protein UlaG (beta-lactamase superfamily)